MPLATVKGFRKGPKDLVEKQYGKAKNKKKFKKWLI
jgi:hypothetical protein